MGAHQKLLCLGQVSGRHYECFCLKKVSGVCQTKKMSRKALKTLNDGGQCPPHPMPLSNARATNEKMWFLDSLKKDHPKGGFRNVARSFDHFTAVHKITRSPFPFSKNFHVAVLQSSIS